LVLVGRWAPAPSSRFWLSRKASPSFCRLWGDQGKSAEAYDVNAPVYGCFTEGFGIADLKGAKELLKELT
jgi:hypothetical protein